MVTNKELADALRGQLAITEPLLEALNHGAYIVQRGKARLSVDMGDLQWEIEQARNVLAALEGTP